jgi:hypothetical protein
MSTKASLRETVARLLNPPATIPITISAIRVGERIT